MTSTRSVAPHSPKQGSKKALIVIAALGAVLILSLAALIYYFTSGRALLTPKNTVTFEPDQSVLGSLTISQDTLQETAKILEQRWGFLGYPAPWTSFEANSSGQIIGKIPTTIAGDYRDQVKAIGVLEFVDFGKRQMQPGTVVNTDYSYGYETAEGTKWHTLMTGGQIHTVSAYKSPAGKYEVLFSLTDNGKKTLTDYTTNNIDSYLGIVMDKVVIACPQIGSPVTNGAGVINGNFTQQSADIFVAIIRSGPLPIPLK
jgi:preprotein translocase subunit SecD